MQLHPTGADPTQQALLVCRNARFNLLVIAAALWVLPGFFAWQAFPWYVVYPSSGLALLITLPIVSAWRRRGRAANWVLAVLPDAVWLNLRDCEYADAEPGESVVSLPWGKIEKACQTTHRYSTSGGDGDTSHKDVYLEFSVSPETALEVRAALQAERKLRTKEHRYLWGGVTVSQGAIKRQPIDVADESTVRVKFSSGTYGLSPGTKQALAAMADYVVIAESGESALGDWHSLEDPDFDKLVLDLIEDGRDIEAIKLLRGRRDVSLTEAKAFVDGVRQRLHE
ncbi:MAG: hypothetical protein AAGA92_09495 [Planctomycetota bacterium]